MDLFDGDLKYKMFYLWHEMNITCPQADALFEQHKTLELGEEPSWGSRNIKEMQIIQALCRPACYMLKHMDGVGFYNDNEIDLTSLPLNTLGEPASVADYYYW